MHWEHCQLDLQLRLRRQRFIFEAEAVQRPLNAFANVEVLVHGEARYLNAAPITRRLPGTVAEKRRDWAVMRALKCH